MHVTIIANGFQEDYIHDLLNHLVDKVDRVDFIGSPIYDRNKLNSKIAFYDYRADQERKSVLLKPFGIIRYYYKLLAHLSRSDSKIVHIQWLRFEFIEGVLISRIMQLMGKKIIYTAHNVLPHNKDGFLIRKKLGLVYRVQNKILVHTSFIKNQIISSFKIPSGKIHVTHHGVYNREKNVEINRDRARKKLNLRENVKVILFFGIIQAYKGFDTLTAAIDQLENSTDYDILVAGRVSKVYEQEFKALVAKTKSKNYTYLLRFLSEEEVEYCFAAADVTVLPYKEASQSGVLFMSYTYGVPVIAPDLGGFSEDVLQTKTGYLFEANNSQSLAASIRQFEKDWTNAGDREKQFIINFAKNNYSWDASCKKIVELYKSMDTSGPQV